MTPSEFDLVVVGGGLAGLSAALRAAERGLAVAVLEQGEDEHYLCNSRMAMGFLTVAGQDSRSDAHRLHAAILAATDGEADGALVRALSDDSGRALRWLLRQDVRMIQFGAPSNRRPLLTPLVRLRSGLNWPGRGADVMLRRLESRLLSLGGRVLRGHRADELVMGGGRCSGVVAAVASGRRRFRAGAVVLADGGFQANAELLQRFITRRPEQLLQRNAGTGRGDALRMAEAVGAAITGANTFYGHVQARDALDTGRLWPYPTLDLPIAAGMAVDQHGRRFADEGLGGVYMANAIARLDHPLGCFAIFDQAIWDGPAAAFVVPPNPHLLCGGGATIHTADTIDGLAAAAGLPARGLGETVAEYNAALACGSISALKPPRSSAVFRPMPIAAPPFYAVPVCAGITYTMGGVAIDERSCVRSAAGGIIPGLYAAGSTTGGHEGGGRAGYTGGLMKALVFGLRAADEIAPAMRNDGAREMRAAGEPVP